MCRWIAFSGESVSPYQFLYEEKHSLIEQSLNARQCKSSVNGDGFGLGWYGGKDIPGVYRDILPAWSDENLRSLSYQIFSRMFMGHVRAATDTATMRSNCHPFRKGACMYMHNGQVGSYLKIRRKMEILLNDKMYPARLGSTDSEVLFLHLLQIGAENDFHNAVEEQIRQILDIMQSEGITEAFRCTSCFSDGSKLWAARFSTDKNVPTLFLDRRENGFLLVSEPLNDIEDDWEIIPENHTICLDWKNKQVSIKEIEFLTQQCK